MHKVGGPVLARVVADSHPMISGDSSDSISDGPWCIFLGATIYPLISLTQDDITVFIWVVDDNEVVFRRTHF